MNSRAIPPVLTAAPVGCGGESAEPGAVLPFPSPPMGGSVGPTMQESVHQWRTAPRHLPEDAPNILIVMFMVGTSLSYVSADANILTERPGIIDTLVAREVTGTNSGFGDLFVAPLGLSGGWRSSTQP